MSPQGQTDYEQQSLDEKVPNETPDVARPAQQSFEGRFAVRSIFWRRKIDWVVLHVPEWLQPLLVFIATFIFFFAASPARHSLVRQLRVLFPGSIFGNWFRAFQIFHNFAWSLTDAAVHRLLKAPFRYTVEGAEFLEQVAAAGGGIVLTAHIGNYDLGSAVFVEKLHREIRMVRAPETDSAAGAHLERAIEQAAGGGVKVDYNTAGSLLSFDLLNALRSGKLVSIQGDRAMGNVSQFPVRMFRQKAWLPSGPIVLALTAEVPIYPIFVLRNGYRSYRFTAKRPILCTRSEAGREADIAEGIQRWADVLAETIKQNWQQWYAFTPVFDQSPSAKA